MREAHPRPSDWRCLTTASYSIDQARQKMGQLFHRPSEAVSFRSPAQEAGLKAVLRLESPLVVVLPTGGGKTLLVQVPALLDPQSVSIMVVPFRALIDDMVQRFRAAQIASFEWTAGQTNPATVVLVSADIAVTSSFMIYARHLREIGLLRRIFFDECHTTFKDHHWRPKLDRLRQLRTLGAQTVCLTATLPPTLVPELEHSMAISQARIIRSSTTRARHRYLVRRCPPHELRTQAVSIGQATMARLQPGQKAVMYAKSQAACEGIATALDCRHYHAAVPDRAAQLAPWVAEGGLIVATSALGTGVDFPGIVFVCHVDMPWSMIDFAQESGRGGRSGDAVDSMILVGEKVVEARLERVASLPPDTMAMARFITTTDCRRFIMSHHLDGPDLAVRCGDQADLVPCDCCGEGISEIQAQHRGQASTWRRVRTALDELSESCAICWVTQGEKDVHIHHTSGQCRQVEDAMAARLTQLRQHTVFSSDSHRCFRCGISQRLCPTGEDVEAACLWPGVVTPMTLVATANATSRAMVTRLGFPDIVDTVITQWEVGQVQRYGRWLGERHPRRIWGENMSNAMAVTIQIILWVHEEPMIY